MSEPSGDEQRKVHRAVAWVGAASAIIAVFDACSLALLLWKWVSREAFGTASLAVTLFYFLDLVTEAGLSTVLVRKEKLDEDAITTVFWLNVMVSVAAFAALLGIGPLIGWIQGQPIVGWMLIAYGTKLLYQNLYFVPAALLRRELRFKELSIVRTLANAGDGIAKVTFAAMGEPVWCFVAGPLARVFITGIGTFIAHPWRPRGKAHFGEARAMLSFGFKSTGSQYLQHLYNNISYQIVGFYFGTSLLGAYRLAYEIVLYPINWVSNVVAQVAFPAFSRVSTRSRELAAQFLQFSRQNLAVALPILVLLLVAAPEFLRVAFPTSGDSPIHLAKWPDIQAAYEVFFPRVGDISTPVRLLCIVGLLRAIDCLYLPLLDAMGFAGRNFAVAGLAAAVLTTFDIAFAALLGDQLSFVSVALGRMLGYPIVIAVHAYLALGQLKMTARAYVGHLAGIVACGAAALVPGLLFGLVLPASLSPLVRLVALGGVSVLTLAALLQIFHGLGVRAVVRALRR
ncbi:MAG: oligosaccharide flippase family protein [Kofleriaceae bacterium]|nr:oligosaccharide flippase family protein [Kofleriaceae bacterium]